MKEIRVIAHNPEMTDMVEMLANVPYASPDGEQLAMQILKPMWKPEGNGFPLVLFIQGSAWTKPDQFWQIPQLSLLARRGFVIASVTHRSSATSPAPAFLQDVKAALRFLRAHASEYGIDGDRVCAWGTSSGGNTALLLGLTGDDPAYETADWAGHSTRVQAVVDCFGPTDLNRMLEKDYWGGDEGDKTLLYDLGGGKTPEAYRERLREISPICRIEPGRELPPFLLLHGDADSVVFYGDTEALYRKLAECGYDAELVRVTNAPHEDTFWGPELLEIIFDFIQKRV